MSEPVEYAINVLLPSSHSAAQILVDGTDAKITNRTLTVVTLLARQQDTAHKLQVAENGKIIHEEPFWATPNHPPLKPFLN